MISQWLSEITMDPEWRRVKSLIITDLVIMLRPGDKSQEMKELELVSSHDPSEWL